MLEIHICRKHQDEISYIITHKMVSIMKQQIYSILLRRCVETVVDLFDIFVCGDIWWVYFDISAEPDT